MINIKGAPVQSADSHSGKSLANGAAVQTCGRTPAAVRALRPDTGMTSVPFFTPFYTEFKSRFVFKADRRERSLKVKFMLGFSRDRKMQEVLLHASSQIIL